MATLSYDSRLIASGTQTTKLHKWKIVKEFKTRLTVLRRLGVTCRIEVTHFKIQCSSSPESGSQTQLESSENAGHEIRNAFGVCEKLNHDHRRPVFYFPTFLSTFVGIQGRKANGAPDHGHGISVTAAIATVVTVWFQNIIAASAYGSPLLTGKFLFIISFSLLFHAVHGANNAAEDFKEENPDDALETLYDRVQKVAVAVLVILLIGGVGVARRMCNRWRPLRAAGQGVPAASEGAQGGAAAAGGVQEAPTAVRGVQEAPTAVRGVQEAPAAVRGVQEAPAAVRGVQEAPAAVRGVQEAPTAVQGVQGVQDVLVAVQGAPERQAGQGIPVLEGGLVLEEVQVPEAVPMLEGVIPVVEGVLEFEGFPLLEGLLEFEGLPALEGAPAVEGDLLEFEGVADPAVGQEPAFDVMDGLVRSPVPARSNPDYEIPPECSSEVNEMPVQGIDEMPEEGNEMPEEGNEMPEEGNEMPEEGNEMPEEDNEMPEEGNEMPEEGNEVPEEP